MAATAEKIERLAGQAQSGIELWRRIEPTDLGAIKRRLKAKHGNLTRAANNIGLPYNSFINAIAGRYQYVSLLEPIQQDLELSDADVLRLWPLLRRWPR